LNFVFHCPQLYATIQGDVWDEMWDCDGSAFGTTSADGSARQT
jgi:hypothetical protein